MKKLMIPVFGLVMGMTVAAGCGDDSTGDCLPNDHTQCSMGITYWMDSCGVQGTVAGVCDCGCNADFTACDDSCSCTPDCAGKACGDDGCGGDCGTCNSGEVCGTDFQCFSCTPDCTGLECGDDGCGGSCGDCQPDETCSTAGICEVEMTDLLVLNNCNVDFVLDAVQMTGAGAQAYLTAHFNHLVQDYCITGGYDGNDVTAYPEKMYYGQHDAADMISLVQLSMSGTMNPEWTVKLDFNPDTDFTTSSTWNASVGGVSPPEVNVGLIRHLGTQSMCLKAIGTSGNVNISSAVDCTLQEGGSFALSGSVQLTNPWDITEYCSNTPPNLPCCS